MLIKNPSTRGFSTVAAISIGLAFVLTILAVAEFSKQDVRLGTHLDLQDQVISMGLSGAAETVGYLTSNTDLQDWAKAKDPNHIAGPYMFTSKSWVDPNGYFFINEHDILDKNGRSVGHWRSFARQVYLDYLKEELQDCYEICTEAWPTNPPPRSSTDSWKQTIFTFVTFENIGEYFLAIQNADLILQAGADFHTASVYGYNLRFTDSSEFKISLDHPIQVKDAYYVGAFYPITPEGLDMFGEDSDGNFKGIIINPHYPDPWQNDNSRFPVQLDRERRFPTLTEEDLLFYKREAQKWPSNGILDNNPAGENNITGDLYPPYYPLGLMGADPETLGPGRSTSIYYSDDDVYIGGVHVHGQVVIVTSKRIIITGDILKLSENTKDNDPGNQLGSLTSYEEKMPPDHCLVLMARDGIVINNTFSLDATKNLDGNLNRLTIEAFLITPDATVTVDRIDASILPVTQSLYIHGAMVLNRTPYLGDFFQDDSGAPAIPARNYVQDLNLYNYPPPIRKYLRIFAQFHYFGGNFSLVFNAAPDPTYHPTFVEE